MRERLRAEVARYRSAEHGGFIRTATASDIAAQLLYYVSLRAASATARTSTAKAPCGRRGLGSIEAMFDPRGAIARAYGE